MKLNPNGMCRRPLLFFFLLLGGFSVAYTQNIDTDNYRTYSGMHNNPDHPEWGAAGTDLIQFTPVGFADGIQAPGGVGRPNPRAISNDMFSQEGLINDPLSLSDFTWSWGQFIDHDVGLTPDGPEPLFIQVPAGDPDFDPFGMGQAIIPMHRNAFNPETGLGEGNPRRYPNTITAFIDGSGVYGSDEERANWLRTFADGKLKVSAGNLLPFNTVTGEFDAPIDPDAPHMDNPTGISDVIFVAGDPRASENPLLCSFHTLFVREHNRQCDLLADKHPDWTDEQLYQHARKIVGGLIQSVVYDEWLPSMGVHLPAYQGFDASIDPQLFNVFTAAAFRMGHTLLNSNLRRVDSQGNEIPQGHLALKDAFFNPFLIMEVGGIEPFLQGMGEQVQQNFDSKVIDDVRNSLFGQPGMGGLDLASININRGRERGLPDFNSVRAAFGLAPYQFFQQINPNAAVFTRLLVLYADLNNIDPWVGMLAENPLPGSLFGQTVHTIMTQQFTNLRDGDRFYYWNDPVLTEEEKLYIQNISLRDIIMYNSGINLMQDNVFSAMDNADICSNMTVSIGGLVRTEDGEPVGDVEIDLVSVESNWIAQTNDEGTFLFAAMPYCDLEYLAPLRDDNPLNGVTTFDLVKIQKHILGVDPLDSPYKLIAADINASGSITTIDLVRMRKVILGIDETFTDNTSWRFVWAAYEFENPDQALSEDFPELMDFSVVSAAEFNEGFIGIKVGDVNGSASPGFTDEVAGRNPLATGLRLTIPDQSVTAGEEYVIEVGAVPAMPIEAYQFELATEGVEILGVKAAMESEYFVSGSDFLRVSYNTDQPVSQAETVFELRLRAQETGPLADFIRLSSQFKAEAYDPHLTIYGVSLTDVPVNAQVQLGQNQPNPFREQTFIPFYLPADDQVRLQILDAAGRLIHQEQRTFGAGAHQWAIQENILSGSGTYFYRLETSTATETMRMLRQ